MDRRFIKNYCRKCLYALEVYGIWCAYYMDVHLRGCVACSMVVECPYRAEFPFAFERSFNTKG